MNRCSFSSQNAQTLLTVGCNKCSCRIAGVFPATARPFIGQSIVTWHLERTMKLFPAKCHERATLRKLWRQTGNTVTREMLTAVAHYLSVMWLFVFHRFDPYALLYNKSLIIMTCPLGNSEFCFPWISLRFKGNKIQNSLFPSGPVIKC